MVAPGSGACCAVAMASSCSMLGSGQPPQVVPVNEAHAPAACTQDEATWSSLVRLSEAAIREPDHAQATAKVQGVMALLDQELALACPFWAEALRLQKDMLTEIFEHYVMLHRADRKNRVAPALPPTLDGAAIEAAFIELNDQACLSAPLRTLGSYRVWQAGQALAPKLRRQRYAINLASDSLAVDASGALGAKPSYARYTGLVLTPVHPALRPQLTALQGQGPQHPQVAQDYVAGAHAYAARHTIRRVVFVNAAGGQIPSFGPQVAERRDGAVSSTYLQLDGWADGTLVTPARAAQTAVDILKLLDLAHGPSLLVVNCNAGLDRSGTMNALVQLIAYTQQMMAEGQGAPQAMQEAFGAIGPTVARLKTARAHAISSAARYEFIHAALAAYADGLMAGAKSA